MKPEIMSRQDDLAFMGQEIRKPKGRPCVCQKCGKEFFSRKSIKETPRTCSLKCLRENSPKWRDCSRCHASIGLGCKKSAKTLGMNHATVAVYWQKNGIRSQCPERSWNVWARRNQKGSFSGLPEWWEDSDLRRAWKIESNPKFPDWSVIWSNEVSRRISNKRYRSMTQSERRQWNKRAWQGKDKANAKRYLRQWKRVKAKSDPAWRIAQSMRTRLSSIMKGANMGGMEGFIGCSIDQLRRHLESGFTKRMTWENYGTYWHVDHVLPVASFNHLDPKQIKQCWHWSNLAPLEAKANLEKSDRITKPQMHLLLECYA